MRKIYMAAGMALVLAACSGEKKADEQAPAQAAPAAPAATGTVHNVDMVLEGTKYLYKPATLSIKAGDIVRFHNRSGGPHNVAFWADSVPAGAAAVLEAAMPDQMSPLNGAFVTEPDAVYEVSFAGAPVGDYKYYCLPHLAVGMVAKLTVTP